MEGRRELQALVAELRARVEWWKESGLELVPTTASPAAADASSRIGTVSDDEPPPSPTSESADQTMSDSRKPSPTEPTESLAALRALIGDCQRCKLCSHRTQIVFGVGNPSAELVFVGEAPGRDEDLKGEPFVGRAGQLLTEIIVKGMKLRREDIYIANIIKCRPPQNRNPEPDEIASCEPFLIRQLEIIRPKAIVALGTFAAQTLLKTRTPITRLRGTWTDYQGVPLMPTFHPAYLLRNPGEKRLVWQDIQQVMKLLGLR